MFEQLIRFWGGPEAIGSHGRATVPLLAFVGPGARSGLPCASGQVYLGSHHVLYIGIIPAVDNEYEFKNPWVRRWHYNRMLVKSTEPYGWFISQLTRAASSAPPAASWEAVCMQPPPNAEPFISNHGISATITMPSGIYLIRI